MKGKRIMGLALTTAVLAGTFSGVALGAAAEEPNTIPLQAHYAAPATEWESQATPIGNGFIGGMVFGGVESDRIQINEHTLWSGGPGANADFDGGATSNASAIHSALQSVRQTLQSEMTDFTRNSSAYLDAAGNVISQNYANSSNVLNLMNQLKGEKDQFGSYQTLGNLYLTDPAYERPLLIGATSDAEPVNGGEVAANLFDGSVGTKWFAGNSAQGSSLTLPVSITWHYSDAMTMTAYQLTSANDMEGRDPSAWTLYGSMTGQENSYVALDSRAGVTFAGRQATNTYTLNTAAQYTYYKLTITAVREAGNPPQLSEIVPQNTGEGSHSPFVNYSRTLDVDNAVARVSYVENGVTFTRDYFVSNPDNVMVIRLTASAPGSITRRVLVNSEQTHKTISVSGNTITMQGQPADQTADGLQFAQQVRVIPQGGSVSAFETGLTVTDADSLLIVMAAGTNYVQCTDTSYDYFSDQNPLTAVAARVNAAAAKGYAALLSAHTADYKALFDRVQLNLGFASAPTKTTAQLLSDYNTTRSNANDDRYLETLYYQFGRYLLIASSREGSLPANLQGIWAEGMNPPWSADYHTNINIQMNYWPAQQTNLAECHTPVIDYINAQVARGTATAQQYHCRQDGGAVRGWTMYHENNIWGNTMPAVSDAFYFPAGGAWTCQDIWEYYDFTRDTTFLSQNFDTLLQAAIFWVDNLWTDARDGTLVSNPSYSPEHGSYSLGASCDQEIIWELFNEVIEAAEVLSITDTARASQVAEIRTALSRLYMPGIGLAGEFLEWKDETTQDITGDGGHRHVNHLYALHPGSYVVAGRSAADNAAVEAMKVTLNTRGDGGTGWSKAWKINFWARLRDGDHAEIMVNQILRESTMQNLFDTHPPFQIDGNFGATAGMTEMLLQSQGDSIDLLAALPAAWANGSVSGLKARGNFEVSMDWANRQLTGATVKSNVGGSCTLRYAGLAGKTIVRQSNGTAVSFTASGNDTVTFATTAGETYVIADSETGGSRVEAENYTAMSGVQTEACGDVGGGEDVGYIDGGDWMDYTVNVPTAGAYRMNVRAASPNGGGLVYIQTGGNSVAQFGVNNTGGWQTYQTVTSGSFALSAGTQTIRLYVQNGGINLNWFELIAAGTGAPLHPVVDTAYQASAVGNNASITGEGYVQNLHNANSYCDFTVQGTGGNATVQVVYAIESVAATAGVIVNGVTESDLSLTPTGGWDTYTGSATFTVNLNSGTNTIRLTGGRSGYNVARIVVSTTPAPVRIQAENYTAMYGVQAEGCGDVGGTQNIGFMDNGDWMEYSVTVPAAGYYTMKLRAASPGGGGLVYVQVGSSTLTQVGVSATGDWQVYQDFTSESVSFSAGTQTIRLFIQNAGLNLNWFELQPA